jgi:cystathionine gamma-synthase
MTRPNSLRPETLLAQAAHYIDAATGAVAPPIHTSVTFARDESYALIGDTLYSRYGSPNFSDVEKVLASLDGGVGAMLFASGLAAIAALFETVETGRHIVVPKVMYFGAQAWVRRISERRGIGLALYDATDPGALAAAIRPGETDIVWVETPCNPTWDVVDIAEAARLAHEAGAIVGVDSTVAPPVTTRALDHGADIVFHSATKYLNGHSDSLAGVLVSARDDARWREIGDVRRLSGGVPGPFEAWLLLRGLRTLCLRYARSSESALRFAETFKSHPRLEAVLYPGLKSHPGHAIAARQMQGGFGGMLSVLVKGDAATALQVCSRLRVFLRATSLGGVESLVEHRKSVEGPDSDVDERLIRFSIGIEAVEDLIEDLDQALGS